jgi:hypothetical protein
VNEDATIEIIKPKDSDSNLVIRVSVTRTYLFVDQLEVNRHNRNRKLMDTAINPPHSFAI